MSTTDLAIIEELDKAMEEAGADPWTLAGGAHHLCEHVGSDSFRTPVLANKSPDGDMMPAQAFASTRAKSIARAKAIALVHSHYPTLKSLAMKGLEAERLREALTALAEPRACLDLTMQLPKDLSADERETCMEIAMLGARAAFDQVSHKATLALEWTCEAGCASPVVGMDREGVPLCAKCTDELRREAALTTPAAGATE